MFKTLSCVVLLHLLFLDYKGVDIHTYFDLPTTQNAGHYSPWVNRWTMYSRQEIFYGVAMYLYLYYSSSSFLATSVIVGPVLIDKLTKCRVLIFHQNWWHVVLDHLACRYDRNLLHQLGYTPERLYFVSQPEWLGVVTVGKDHDHVTVCDSWNPVCYGDDCATWKFFLDHPLQDGVGGRVDGCCRLIKDQNLVPSEENTRKAEELPLTGAPVLAVITHWKHQDD